MSALTNPFSSGGSFGQIGSSLPWNSGQSGASALSASTPGGVAAAYQGAYNSALGMNESNYNNIMAGYQQTIGAQTSAQQAIQAGYTGLYNNVIGNIQNSYAGQNTQLQNQAAQNLATSSQQLVDRGLGNTTIQTSVNQGVNNQLAQQQQLLTGQEAGQVAQYQNQIGQAGLQNQEQGLQATTGLAVDQLNTMNSANFAYPNAGLYGQLAQTAAQNAALKRYGGGMGGSLPSVAGPQLGYTPSSNYYGGTGAGDVGGGSFSGSAQPGAAAAAAGSSPNVPDPAWADTGAGSYATYGSASDGESDYGSAPDYGGGGDY